MMNQGGIVANGALLLWIPFAIVLFFTMRPERAALITIFGGLLFLPELVSFKLPLLPPLGKQVIPYLAALIGYTFRSPRQVWRLPRERWVLFLTVMLVVDGFGIALTNRDSLTYGIWRKIELPGLTINDGLYVAISSIFRIALPFFMGTVVVREVGDLQDLFRFLVKAGLIYSFFALLEVRLSPQLHNWVYGFHANQFLQTIRFGGFRPTVFLAHGLTVGLFFCVCALSAAPLARLRLRAAWGMSARTTLLILVVVLILCKSTAAFIYAALSAPLILFGSVKMQQRLAVVFCVIVLVYPSMRESDVFPTATVSSLANLAGADRQQSIQYRFDNEDILVKKASQRPWFGWGEYNRNEVFDGDAKPVSVTDGEWIVALGITGFVGLLARFFLLLTPVFLAGRRLRRSRDDFERRLVAATSLIVAVTAIDLLPNSLASNYPYFLSGALLSASAALGQSRWGTETVTYEAEVELPPETQTGPGTVTGWGEG